MSMSRNIIIPCPKCKTEYEIKIFDSVNTDYSENIAEELLSGEFFCHICPSCGYETIVNHNLLYNDMKHGMFIWLVHNNANEAVSYVHKSAQDYGIPSRIVRNIYEFREKIRIIESGLTTV